MIESEIGYHGSKSNNDLFVKEQRVDDSYFEDRSININSSKLRCTLMGLERDSLNKILSKPLNRYYSTSTIQNDTSQKTELILDPNFISGFIDGEGSFSVTFIKDKSYVGLHLLESHVRRHFDKKVPVGNSLIKSPVLIVQYVVRDIEDCVG